MTYRKLFVILSLAATLVLLAVWGLSLRTKTTTSLGPLVVETIHGSLRLILLEELKCPFSPNRFYPGWGILGHFARTPQPPAPFRDSLGKWSYTRTERELELHRVHAGGMTIPTTILWREKTLLIPLWAPWLLFIGSLFAFCRFMELRTGSGRERSLAIADLEKQRPTPAPHLAPQHPEP